MHHSLPYLSYLHYLRETFKPTYVFHRECNNNQPTCPIFPSIRHATHTPTTMSTKLRSYVLAAAVAGVTATGAWYGAGLKFRREVQEVSLVDIPTDKHSFHARGKERSSVELTNDVSNFEQERKTYQEASHDERIAYMEAARRDLVQRREELQQKIDRLTAAGGRNDEKKEQQKNGNGNGNANGNGNGDKAMLADASGRAGG